MNLKNILNIIQDDIVDLVHNQKIYNDTKNKLNINLKKPFEQDEIYNDIYGRYPAEGVEKEIYGAKVRIRIAHQTGKNQSDINSADVVYEIEDLKYIIVQYKKGNQKNISIDIDQLNKLLMSCPDRCTFKKNEMRQFSEPRLNGLCGIYYKLMSPAGISYLHACAVKSLLGGKVFKDNGNNGISKNTFEELFAKCKIGAPVTMSEVLRRQSTILEHDDLVVHVTQENKFLGHKVGWGR